ncbi:MAG: Jag N-terminal domain-containing protein, partial [Candidatus Riflebacteria bacterium]|nr:Jag N-terminal domain-containing protein [Candidatus Riflebacteria bacterium]
MNTTRTIEITAKTEEEARGIANAELNDNEVVVSSEVLSAPARGIFGFVGKQEFKIRFSIGEKPAPVIAEKAVEHRAPRDVDAAPPRNVTRDDRVSSERESESRQRQPRRSGRSDTLSRPRGQGRDFREDSEADVAEEIHLPDRPREPVTEAIKNNPGYQE